MGREVPRKQDDRKQDFEAAAASNRVVRMDSLRLLSKGWDQKGPGACACAGVGGSSGREGRQGQEMR